MMQAVIIKLAGQYMPASTFVVRRLERYPTINLEVSVQNGHICYSSKFMFDHRSEEDSKEGQLRIVSDLQGRLHVTRNGEAFRDHAELSKFLLMPVFEYLKGTR